MTILFASGEDTGFTGFPVIPSMGVGAGRFRSQFCRGAMSIATVPTTADPPANRFQTPTFTPSNLVWVHAQIYDAGGTTNTNQQGLILRSPDGVSRILVRQGASAGLAKISTRNAAGTITDLGSPFSTGLSPSTLTAFDIKVDYSASGGIQVWIGGVSVFTYTGDPRTDSATTLNQVEFANMLSNGGMFWSEIIIADVDTRGMGLWTLAPNATGNTQSWTPNTVGNINEVALSDSTAIATPSVNAISEWAVSVAVPAGTFTVLALVQEARLQCGTSGPQHFDWIVRTGGVDYLAGQNVSINTSYTNFSNQQWLVNPATGSAWLPTDFSAAGFNYGIKSLT